MGKPYIMQRELAKCVTGFSVPLEYLKQDIKKIKTGNWGVGAHGGDLELKFALQWIALSLVAPGKTITYFAEGHKDAQNLPALISLNEKNRLSVNQGWHMLLLMSAEDPRRRCSLVRFAEKLTEIFKMLEQQSRAAQAAQAKKKAASRAAIPENETVL